MSRFLAGIGIFLTVAYLGFVVWLIGNPVLDLRGLDLNELGDFFAGIFGPLAILWLVLGYFQQGIELRQNNVALELQAKELRSSVVQQTEMVEAQKVGLRNYEKTLEPLFKLTAGHTEFVEGEENLHLHLQNYGEYCERIVVVVSNNKYPLRFETMFGGEGRGFLVGFSSSNDEAFNIEVCVEYVNRGGVKGRQSFAVKEYYDDGGIVVRATKMAFLS
ncbi:hypothetical protein ACUTAH_02905 [Metapseudomonas furukawaii]|uniref:hypothetical protein n=1 Tax=Metapseudomonas furukawaii TaxID=1149133 RepID=UPI004046450B